MGDASSMEISASDRFARERGQWLSRIANDRSLPPLAACVAIRLANDFMDRRQKDRAAYMTISRLHREMQASERTIQGALKALVTASYLAAAERPGKTTVYTMIAAHCEHAAADLQSIDGNQGAQSRNPRRIASHSAPATPADLRQEFGRDPRRIASASPAESCQLPPQNRVNAYKEEPLDRTHRLEPIEEGSLRSPSARDENPADDLKSIEQPSPSISAKIEPAEPSQGAFRKAETKTSAKPVQIAPAGRAAKLLREPAQVDMLAEDASRQLRETMIAFRKAYPPSQNTPTNDAGWQAVAEEMRKALAVALPAEIIAGTDRYAASNPDPEWIYGPKRFLAEEMFRKSWPLRIPRAAGSAYDRVAAAQDSQNDTIGRAYSDLMEARR